MELTDVAKKVFGNEYFQGNTSRFSSKASKKIFLIDTRDWLEEFLNDLVSQSSATSQDKDTRQGRIGNTNVYFTLDRSFGIVAINQEGLNVVAACRFATVAASCGVFSGKWMYELHLGSKGIMQIGWCSNLCVFTIDRGCGDTQNSYAFDGSRIKSWNMLSREYGELWKTGDVIGVCIDLENATISFYRNGRSMGIAFRDLSIGAGMMYLPCISLVEGESVFANFGARPFRYPVPCYQPLQEKPHGKIKQAEYLFKWFNKLLCIVVPTEPTIVENGVPGDVNDDIFWDRMFSLLCYHLNIIIMNRYCLFNNFLPFIIEISAIKEASDTIELDKYRKFMDETWMFVKEKNIEKSLYNIFNYFTNNFKQVSETIYCPMKNQILLLVQVILSHEMTRKYLIKNLMLERLDIFAFMHHKPLDEKFFINLIGPAWWESKGVVSEVEKNKKSFQNSFTKVEKYYDEMEQRQCKIIKLLLDNTDGNATECSSRTSFMKKLRKFCWHELEYVKNDLNSKLPTSIAYASFLRMVKVLDELWQEEIGTEKMELSAKSFYDHTFRYSNCDRIGGLEQYLVHTYHDELAFELGENHSLFSDSERQTPAIPFQDLRTIVGLTEAMNVLESNESVLENFIMPTTSNGPFYQALFAPYLRENMSDAVSGNMDSKLSLLELYEDLLMFFMSAVAKHCKKISKVIVNLKQNAAEFNVTYLNHKKFKNKRPGLDPLYTSLQICVDLQKDDLSKRARKQAWIEHVLLSYPRYQYFIKIFNILLQTVINAEKEGDLFVFLPDFYLEGCDIFTEVLIKDFFIFKHYEKDLDSMFQELAELMIKLVGDTRIKHIDSKKIPINILANLASNSTGMEILESISQEKSRELVEKLMLPYNERHWKASNWILVRFWHGSGYGFRYTNLPHHNSNLHYPNNPMNYVMYNIVCSPSPYYQEIIREKLLDQNTSVPALLDSLIGELHWTFGEFLTPMQELQRAIERNEQLLMMGRLYKMCSAYFDKTIGLLRVLDMFIALAPEVFLESYYPESSAHTRRVIQVVLLIIHRISSKHGCFRIVMNSRIAVLDNVEYFPIESACVAILLGILRSELQNFSEEELTIPPFCRMVLTDPSYDHENLSNLIGSPESRNNTVVSLHDYESVVMLETELAEARKMLYVLEVSRPKLSKAKVIPEDELCTICYSSAFDVKFNPCGHNSCLSCISYHLNKTRLCFFCKRPIAKVIRISDDEIIDYLTEKETEISEET